MKTPPPTLVPLAQLRAMVGRVSRDREPQEGKSNFLSAGDSLRRRRRSLRSIARLSELAGNVCRLSSSLKSRLIEWKSYYFSGDVFSKHDMAIQIIQTSIHCMTLLTTRTTLIIRACACL